ncbi:phage terminase large subunit family protein [Dechloromonas sp. TW-R-39-2]|uniref:phage terminase large subunit family protein n=1 Tax=Dechloromonas sp. TW-R-39-2 TaxID=2654218 RepID=UPI00193DA1AA|nr:phage terminase large subunit family protein [Dechloromonas sp. TW-R-39-2]QRM19552.1 phage terminase large subunit family protein [Dechloromonas sp. TW-R-39-2]
MYASASGQICAAMSRGLAPRKPLTVSQWSDLERRLSSKGSAEPGRWRTDRNPPLREPMDCLSARSTVKDVALMFPIQFGKTEVAVNALGYTMDHNPGPVMVCLPGEVSMNKWVAQKLNPMIEETPAVRATLTSTDSRNGSNRREFKDFDGGQLYLEHAGSPARLKSTTVRTLIVDELDEFSANLQGGDDPVSLLEGRTSAFPATYKRLYISTPQIRGMSRIEFAYLKSDQRRYFVPCPHCGEMQHLEWSGLRWGPGGTGVAYVCRECGSLIDEHHKTAMIAAGRWIPENPGAKTRGYHINGLYYQIGLGPRWADLVETWLEAQNDPAKLKTFINDRLAEPWEDPAMRAVKHNIIADRAEPYQLRIAPYGTLAITAGVDTQDNRLAVQIVGWGRGMACWIIDYIELPGDPADDAVWLSLAALINKGIEHESGLVMDIQATCIDAGGHRTEAVKHFVRSGVVDPSSAEKIHKIRRSLAIFGAVPNNAPVLSKGKMQDVDWRGRYDKRGVLIQHVGTVGIKHLLYSRLSTDADKAQDARLVHFSDQLPSEYFAGLISEQYNPSKNRFEKKRGARNEPLDTWVYAYAAAHHPELRLHRATRAEWDRMEAKITAFKHQKITEVGNVPTTEPVTREQRAAAPAPRAKSLPVGSNDWNSRL